MFWAEIWKISEFLSENFQFLVVKFTIYLNRRVFVLVFWLVFLVYFLFCILLVLHFHQNFLGIFFYVSQERGFDILSKLSPSRDNLHEMWKLSGKNKKSISTYRLLKLLPIRAQLFKANDVVSSQFVKILIEWYANMLKCFAEKMWVAFAKATHIFSAKNIRILCIESAKTVKEMTLNELVKLTMLWTTGARVLSIKAWWFILLPFYKPTRKYSKTIQVDSLIYGKAVASRKGRLYIHKHTHARTHARAHTRARAECVRERESERGGAKINVLTRTVWQVFDSFYFS